MISASMDSGRVRLLLSAALLISSCACSLGESEKPTSRAEGLSATKSVLTVQENGKSESPSGRPSSPTDSATLNSPGSETMVSVRVFDKAGSLVGPVASEKVVKTDEQWQAQLTPEQYRITRKAGTEPAFCGTLLDNKKEGVYACVCCGLPLFSSSAKFHSGTGWPSFFQPISDENIEELTDRGHGMVRVEIRCVRCDGHLGHVFEDGPRPTGLRYCLNSESLKFAADTELASLADPAAEKAGTDERGAAAASSTQRATVVFAGGCFWCVEAVFEELDGVIDAISGYAGGSQETADYKSVCSGTTGHAEAVQVVFDPTKISFEELLKVHFATHDPTTLNRQGNDVGTQYRSAIFYANDQEKAIATAFLEDLRDAKAFDAPIVTTLEPLVKFFPAEDYHQNYVCQNPTQGYVRAVALPKVEKVRKKFQEQLKERSPLQK